MHVRLRYPANPEGGKRIGRGFRVELVLEADELELPRGTAIDISAIVQSVRPQLKATDVATVDLTILAFDMQPLTELSELEEEITK